MPYFSLTRKANPTARSEGSSCCAWRSKGPAILHAILEGERDPHELAALCQSNVT
jgi:hypothetical protein